MPLVIVGASNICGAHHGWSAREKGGVKGGAKGGEGGGGAVRAIWAAAVECPVGSVQKIVLR